MGLADRIAKIEAKLSASASVDIPALFITAGDGDPSEPYVVEHAGVTWTQQADEAHSDLMHRAHAQIRQMPLADQNVSDERFPVLVLVARRRGDAGRPHLEGAAS